MREFKVGDVVRLKSGGPIMTVIGYNDGIVDTSFFDKNDFPHNWKYFPEMLEFYVENSGVTYS